MVNDLENPDFLKDYLLETIRITTIDSVVNSLDEARVAAGLSKASLARAINSDPATMRRLFSGQASNPTLGTLAEVATALGMKVTLEPLPNADRSTLTEPLMGGKSVDVAGLATYLERLRTSPSAEELTRRDDS